MTLKQLNLVFIFRQLNEYKYRIHLFLATWSNMNSKPENSVLVFEYPIFGIWYSNILIYSCYTELYDSQSWDLITYNNETMWLTICTTDRLKPYKWVTIKRGKIGPNTNGIFNTINENLLDLWWAKLRVCFCGDHLLNRWSLDEHNINIWVLDEGLHYTWLWYNCVILLVVKSLTSVNTAYY